MEKLFCIRMETGVERDTFVGQRRDTIADRKVGNDFFIDLHESILCFCCAAIEMILTHGRIAVYGAALYVKIKQNGLQKQVGRSTIYQVDKLSVKGIDL